MINGAEAEEFSKCTRSVLSACQRFLSGNKLAHID